MGSAQNKIILFLFYDNAVMNPISSRLTKNELKK